MDKKIKILIVGDIKGNFRQIFNRVESVNKKSGPFDILLCAGEFFGKNNDELIAYKNGYKNVPIPTYILGPTSEDTAKQYRDMDDGEICQNLTYLGKRGLYTLSSGVKVAYLSGLEETDRTKGMEWTFSKEDAQSVRNSCIASKGSLTDYKGVDILVTSQWPQGIDRKKENASKLVSYLAKSIKPRYHFCGDSAMYLELSPFRNAADEVTQFELVTRFIALADVNNTQKEKYIYALNITPAEKMRVMDLIQKTTDEIASPYTEVDLRDMQQKNSSDTNKQYFYDLETDHQNQHHRGKKRGFGYNEQSTKKQRPVFDMEKCWFCLSSAEVEKHLVITIGENFYLALAKGPINESHILMLPITHVQSASLLPKEDWDELEQYKDALKKMCKKEGQVVCFIERNYKCSHLQINAIAIDAGYEWKIKHSFEDKSEEYNIQFETVPKIEDPSDLPDKGPYFVAELPDGTCLLTQQMKNFPLHFAREVFCCENLLNCDEKIDWKDCKLTKEEETGMVLKLREKFKPFAFS
uniref:Cwf19-like C-terminal domain-containing protein n=1 Tax=Tabanus bromius TaxID=304241 RepID=A0A0K8TQM9_TABBR